MICVVASDVPDGGGTAAAAAAAATLTESRSS